MYIYWKTYIKNIKLWLYIFLEKIKKKKKIHNYLINEENIYMKKKKNKMKIIYNIIYIITKIESALMAMQS